MSEPKKRTENVEGLTHLNWNKLQMSFIESDNDDDDDVWAVKLWKPFESHLHNWFHEIIRKEEEWVYLSWNSWTYFSCLSYAPLEMVSDEFL